jgi:hypothetical protein
MQNTGLEPAKQTAYFEYDFNADGGAVGAIAVSGNPIPSGSIITSGVVHVKTAVTSDGSATVAIQALSSEDILAATAKASLTLNALLDVVPDGAAANMIRTTSNVTSLTFTVGTAALTAGKICVALEYYVTA